MSRAIPQSIINGIAAMLLPYKGNAATPAVIAAKLESIGPATVSLAKMAEGCGITKTAMLARLQKFGVKPVSTGGKRGRESMYSYEDVVNVLD